MKTKWGAPASSVTAWPSFLPSQEWGWCHWARPTGTYAPACGQGQLLTVGA
jgi:hypothetical protein